MVVVGGGAIGLELGSVWSRLGTEVTIIEFAKKICGPMDAGLSKRLMLILKKQGLKFITEAKVTGAKSTKNGLNVLFENLKTGASANLDCDICLVAVGAKTFYRKIRFGTCGP